MVLVVKSRSLAVIAKSSQAVLLINNHLMLVILVFCIRLLWVSSYFFVDFYRIKIQFSWTFWCWRRLSLNFWCYRLRLLHYRLRLLHWFLLRIFWCTISFFFLIHLDPMTTISTLPQCQKLKNLGLSRLLRTNTWVIFLVLLGFRVKLL